MSCFSNNCAGNVSPDPHQRVCYSQGLVLGVDEFVQEEIYFLEKDRSHNRGLHGYGTYCGLFVEIQDTASEGPQVWVGPGAAVDPRGRVIRVSQAQCAQINDWLQRFGSQIGSPPPSSPDLVRLYLKLCYRECATELVPVPSGPCRTSDETSVPSRVADDFRLELSLSPPDQTEANVVREFGALLRSLEFTDEQPPTITLDEWETLVRALGSTGSPSSPPLPVPSGSPPGFVISPQDADEFLRRSFQIWVTEVRPGLLPNGSNCAGGPPVEGCVLLSELRFAVREAAGQLIVDGLAADVQNNQETRPFLLHTQLLQELRTGADLRQSDHGELFGLEDDDHTQYLLVQDRGGSPAPIVDTLLRDLSADDTHHVTGLADARPGTRDAMPVGQPAGTALFGAAGDLTGTYPNPTIARLQNQLVTAAAPAANQVLQFGGGAWTPQTLTFVPGDLTGAYPSPTIARLQGQTLDAPAPLPDQILRFIGGSWVAVDLPGSAAPPLPPILETNLTRIMRLSWTHGAAINTMADLSLPVQLLNGTLLQEATLVVIFGRRVPGDALVRVEDGSLDPDSFQVFFEMGDNPLPGIALRVRALPLLGRVIPVRPRDIANPAVGFDEVPSPAPAAAIVLPRALRAAFDSSGRLIVVLRGDHVLDDTRRAIDAEFPRSELPTGDRPRNVDLGIQGGQFYSWLDLPTRVVGFNSLNLRTITAPDIVALNIPGMTAAVARRIVAFIAQNPNFTSLSDLQQANVSGAIIGELSRLLTH